MVSEIQKIRAKLKALEEKKRREDDMHGIFWEEASKRAEQCNKR